MCEGEVLVHHAGWRMFAVVSQRPRHAGVLPRGGGWVTLHSSSALGIVGAAPGLVPSAHPSLSPVFPGPLGQGSCSSLFLTPSPAARNARLLLLGGCCIRGPSCLILEVRKLRPKEGQGLVQVAQRVLASVSTRIRAS